MIESIGLVIGSVVATLIAAFPILNKIMAARTELSAQNVLNTALTRLDNEREELRKRAEVIAMERDEARDQLWQVRRQLEEVNSRLSVLSNENVELKTAMQELGKQNRLLREALIEKDKKIDQWMARADELLTRISSN